MFYFIFLYTVIISVLISVDSFSKTFYLKGNFELSGCGKIFYFCGRFGDEIFW